MFAAPKDNVFKVADQWRGLQTDMFRYQIDCQVPLPQFQLLHGLKYQMGKLKGSVSTYLIGS